MIRFITANWIWFALIGAMLLMHRGHMGHGGGCGGHGAHDHDRRTPDAAVKRTSAPDGTTDSHGEHLASAGADGRRHRGC